MIGLDILIHPYIIVSCDFIGSPSSLSFWYCLSLDSGHLTLKEKGSHIVLIESLHLEFLTLSLIYG